MLFLFLIKEKFEYWGIVKFNLTPSKQRSFDQELEITCSTAKHFHKVTVKIERFDRHPTESRENKIVK